MVTTTSRASLTRSAISVILGGGRGTRLWPLTKYRAKPAVPLAGKYRLIDIPISNCLNSGLDRIYILTQFQSSSLNRHITRTYHLDPFSRGFVDLEAAHMSQETTDWYQGTADSVRRNLKTLTQWQPRNVVILPGDTIFRMDLSSLLAFHEDQQADVTIAMHSTAISDASSFGIITIDDDNRITQLTEKPSPGEVAPLIMTPDRLKKLGMTPDKPLLASMGIYVFRTDVLKRILSENESFTDFGHDILPYAVRNGRVCGYVFGDFWADIGTIKAFYEVNLDLAKPNPDFAFYYPDSPIYTSMRFLPSTRLGKVTTRDALIAEGCRILQADLDCCMIGLRSIIGQKVRMRRTIMLGADYFEEGRPQNGFEPVPDDAPPIGVGDGCEIEGAIIDKNARIGPNCRIVNKNGLDDFDDPHERYYIREGIVIIPKHAIIEPGTVI